MKVGSQNHNMNTYTGTKRDGDIEETAVRMGTCHTQWIPFPVSLFDRKREVLRVFFSKRERPFPFITQHSRESKKSAVSFVYELKRQIELIVTIADDHSRCDSRDRRISCQFQLATSSLLANVEICALNICMNHARTLPFSVSVSCLISHSLELSKSLEAECSKSLSPQLEVCDHKMWNVAVAESIHNSVIN